METLDPTAVAGFVMDDDLLDFSLDGEEDGGDVLKTTKVPSSSLESSNPNPDDQSRSLPECVEEELEWLSNKDAFPEVETCLDIISVHPRVAPNHQSPVSVLENSSTSSHSNGSAIMSCCGTIRIPVLYPVRARSKRRRKQRRGFPEVMGPHRWSQLSIKTGKQRLATMLPPLQPARQPAPDSVGRRCHHCGAESTPQWRTGPMGPKTLCNACGVRYKSGRLVPEYRPASSPSFSTVLHSNSHRKIMEMRKKKEMGGGMAVNGAYGYL